MKKIILVILVVWLLSSCEEAIKNTHEENLAKKQECFELWYKTYLEASWNINCSSSRAESPVMECIREYTEVIDEKYNNPDHVTNLIEDDYSNVVKTCNEIFWLTK